jgi:hypothetical protein
LLNETIKKAVKERIIELKQQAVAKLKAAEADKKKQTDEAQKKAEAEKAAKKVQVLNRQIRI